MYIYIYIYIDIYIYIYIYNWGAAADQRCVLVQDVGSKLETLKQSHVTRLASLRL